MEDKQVDYSLAVTDVECAIFHRWYEMTSVFQSAAF